VATKVQIATAARIREDDHDRSRGVIMSKVDAEE
jgi:hypothetical protein